MSASNSWAEFAAVYCGHVKPSSSATAKGELKQPMRRDAREAFGHGVRAKRSKSGAVSFDLLAAERPCTTLAPRSAPLPLPSPRHRRKLVNPEKSLLGEIAPAGSGGAQRVFRYAPLSSGLDIIRRVLGRHEIAV